MKPLLFIIFVISVLRFGYGLRKFPDNFKFGAATSSYQVEGAYNLNGKGENIWDRLTNTTNLVVDGSNGEIACDSYHHYKRDVEMLVEMKADYYRFSLNWARILPNGRTNMINQDGIQYYNNLIDELLANGVEPSITLYHWELPQELQELGGWANPMVVEYFVEYAEIAFRTFGDRVKTWLTMNEPVIICLQGYGLEEKAPALNMAGIGEYLCGHNIIKAHAKAYRLYEKMFKPTQKGRVGLTFSSIWTEPTPESSPDLADFAMEFELGWFAHPIYSLEGDYPKVMKDKVYNKSISQGYLSSRLPEFTQEEIKYIRGSYDFFGLNHYTSLMVKQRTIETYRVPSFYDDRDLMLFYDESWPTTASEWIRVVPWGLTKLLGWIRRNYGNPELIVFENGYSDTGGLEDDGRIDYYHRYLNALLDAIDEGSHITGYTAWSLMDNFEWLGGYTEKLGLFAVDFNDPQRRRTPKKSVGYFRQIIETHSIEEVRD